MEYLLVMTFSGSTMTVIYLLLKYLLKGKASSRLYYLTAKAAVLFFLIPLPFMKGWYRKAVRAVISKERMESVRISLAWENYIVHAGRKMYGNVYTVIQTTVVAVWLLVICIMTVRTLLEFLQVRRLIAGYAAEELTENQGTVFEKLGKQTGVRRRVILYQGDWTMTYGICRPVIICSKEMESREAEMLVRHEMIHIKRLDTLWKMLAWVAMLLHWWNPFARKLWRDFERVCECSCDEIAVQGKTREEVKEYLRLLVYEASAAAEPGAGSMRWKSSFTDNAERIKERVENLMKNEKKWNRYAAGMLVAVLAFANSMTVFAYRDTFHQEVPENTPQEEVTEILRTDSFTFTPDGAEAEDFEAQHETEILYDKQFTDTEGNSYPYSEKDTLAVYRSCSHDLVSGTATEHVKFSDGSCKVKEFRAQRCSKCGYVIRGEEISVTTYRVCPH